MEAQGGASKPLPRLPHVDVGSLELKASFFLLFSLPLNLLFFTFSIFLFLVRMSGAGLR